MRGFGRPLRRAAIVGAGLAGLTCARTLLEHGTEVVVIDKGRSPGGRLATRRIPPLSFDLGAQYFTVRDDLFAKRLQAMIEQGVCAPWQGRFGATDGRGSSITPTPFVDRFVGTPGMSAIARYESLDVPILSSHRVDRIERRGDALFLLGVQGTAQETLPPSGPSVESGARRELGPFDAVAVCLPANQAARLLADIAPSVAMTAAEVDLEPCVALGLVAGLDDPLSAIPFDGIFIGRDDRPRDTGVSWAARDSSKPGRPAGERWVVHADGEWSRERLAASAPELERSLLEELSRSLGLPPMRPVATTLMRWSHAKATKPRNERAWIDPHLPIAVGGDWAAGGRVEGAFLSGLAVADLLLRSSA